MMGGIAYTAPKLTQTAGGVNQGKVATGCPSCKGNWVLFYVLIMIYFQ